MLTYIQVTLNNNPMRGGIEINSTALVGSIGSVTKIYIRRKKTEETTWNTVHTVTVASLSNLSFDLLDITTASRNSYEYSVDIYAGNTQLESQNIGIVECEFEGLFIGNFDRQYITGTNFKVDSTMNEEVSYVTTLGSRTPYRISNSAASYSTGSCSGYFFKITGDNKKLIPDYNYSYNTEIANFLTDGTGKILKTTDGQMWYISVDGQVSKPFNDNYLGMNAIEFNWTEIGDIPIIGMAVG